MNATTPPIDALGQRHQCCTRRSDDRRLSPGEAPFPDIVWVRGGTFRMGSDKHYPEERPRHRVTVDGFWMDRYPVSNERFAQFIDATLRTATGSKT